MSFQIEERSFDEHGNHFLSRLLAAIFQTEPNHCFANAWRCFVLSPDLFRPHGTYVEGWHVIDLPKDVLVVEHGWLERYGRIVDPSIVLLAPSSLPVFYYPGVVRSWEETEALEGALFPWVRHDGKHGEDGLGHPSYKAARDAAVRKVYALAQASIPPKAMHFWIARDGADLPLPPEARADQASFAVLGNGTLDIRQSCQIALQIQAAPGRCWHNARDGMLQLPDRFASARYVEGWMIEELVDAIRVVEHGWIETPSGTIIDPTLVADDPPLSVAYLPGESLTWLELSAYAGHAFPRARYAEHYSQSYQQACQHALAQAEQLAWKTGKPVRCCPGEITIFSLSGGLTQTCWDFPVPSAPSERMRRFLALTRGTIEL